MTAPSDRQTPPQSGSPYPYRRFDLCTVRRLDVQRLIEAGRQWPDDELPPQHGSSDDPRYPSPRHLRQVLSFVIDFVLHAGIGAGVVFALAQREDTATAFLAGVGVFFGLSIVDRIVVQRIFRASAGKLITGLRVIRDDTGEAPTVWSLVKRWFSGIGTVLSLLST